MVNPIDEVWRHAILPIEATIGDAIRNLDESAIKIVLVVNQGNLLEGIVTDGDIRRGLLRGFGINSALNNIIHRNALVVQPGLERDLVMQLMLANKIQQIPIVDKSHHIVGLHLWNEINTQPSRPNLMIIMAGGMGTRLRPFTQDCPKPLLPIAGKPMLQHIIERAKLAGFNNFVLSIHYLGHMIEGYFGNGRDFGVNIEYIKELSPLGTAGALSLFERSPQHPFVVTNGDVITDIHYDELLDFHIHNGADATMAVRMHEWQNPFGVVQIDGVDIVSLEEKPIFRSHINAGIYVLEPSVLSYLEVNAYCNMPTLFERLKNNERRTVAYPMHESWLDLGRIEDLEQAHKEGNKKLIQKKDR